MLASLAALSCGVASNDPPVALPRAVAAPKKPEPVVVSIVVDQLGAWAFAERASTLPKTGGFARLLREGLYVRDMRYAHAVTDTAPGHSSLYTGQPPRHSGIFANDVIDLDDPKPHSILRDPSTRLVGDGGATDAAGASLARLEAPVVADFFRRAKPNADIVTISLKDRGAIFGGGHSPSASLWFDTKLDAFVTSTAFATGLPAWAKTDCSHDALVAMRAAQWNPLDPAWVASHASTPDAQQGEGDESGYGTAFPHLVTASARPANAFRSSPYADAAVAALAIDAIHAHDLDRPMLLALSFSGNDTIGHLFGPDSWEVWDNFLRLDGLLAKVFSELDAKVGAEGWSLLLSGDHGASTMPEAGDAARPSCKAKTTDSWERPCGELGRLMPDALGDEVEAAARKALGKSAPASRMVLGVADPFLYLTRETLALPAPQRAAAEEAVKAALLAKPGVDGVRRYAPDPCPEGESLDALICHSLSAKNPDAFYVLPKPGFFFDAGYIAGKGSSHGVPYLYNRSVPLIVRAPHAVTPGQTDAAPRRFTAFTATLAAMLGVRGFPAPQEESIVH